MITAFACCYDCGGVCRETDLLPPVDGFGSMEEARAWQEKAQAEADDRNHAWGVTFHDEDRDFSFPKFDRDSARYGRHAHTVYQEHWRRCATRAGGICTCARDDDGVYRIHCEVSRYIDGIDAPLTIQRPEFYGPYR